MSKRILCHHPYATVFKSNPRKCVKCGGYVTLEHYKRSYDHDKILATRTGRAQRVIWILEQRRMPDGQWEACTGSVIRLRPQDFDQGLFKRESFSRYEFRSSAYDRVPQPPPPVTRGPVEPPKPPRDRGVR